MAGRDYLLPALIEDTIPCVRLVEEPRPLVLIFVIGWSARIRDSSKGFPVTLGPYNLAVKPSRRSDLSLFGSTAGEVLGESELRLDHELICHQETLSSRRDPFAEQVRMIVAEREEAAAREERYSIFYWIRASKDSHNTPTSEPPTLFNSKDPICNILDAICHIEAKSQKQTHARSPVGSVGNPTGVKAPTEQAGKITHMRNPYEEPTLQVKSAEPHVISSDSVQPFFTVKSDTEANAAAALKHPHAVAEKNGVKDGRSGVFRDGGKGAGDPLAADFVKKTVFEDFSQPGFANEEFVQTRIYAGMLYNVLNYQFPMNGRWIVSVSHKLQEIGTMQFGGPGVQKNALVIFKMVLSMVLFASIPAKVGATAPEPAREGTLQAANSDSNSSNFAFGIVAAVGVFFTIIQVLLSMKCWRRPSPVRTVERWCYEKVVEEEGV